MQYILSEATKSVSLNDHSVHNDKDAIWSGNTNGEKAWSLCKVSIQPAHELGVPTKCVIRATLRDLRWLVLTILSI